MKRPSQLTQLIWDFYRENHQELRQLKPLGSCKVFRRWGSLHIRCDRPEVAEAILQAGQVLKEPVSQLRLARKIKVLLDGEPVDVIDVKSQQSTISQEIQQRSRQIW